MKKLEYIAPSMTMVVIDNHAGVMVTSPTSTNITDVTVWDDPAPSDMEGQSRMVNPWNEWEL